MTKISPGTAPATLSTCIRSTQNRMSVAAARGAGLDVQSGLLAEAEITKLVELVPEIAARTGDPVAHHAEIEEMKQLVKPDAVLGAIEEAQADV